MRAMRHSAARAPLSGAGPDGAQHVVVCLREDTVQYAADRVREAGGLATVVIPRPSGTLCPVVWEQGEHLEEALPLATEPGVHPGSELGMVLDLLDTTDDASVSFRITVGAQEAAIREGTDLVMPV